MSKRAVPFRSADDEEPIMPEQVPAMTEKASKKAKPVLEWYAMDEAPKECPIYVTVDPDQDPEGVMVLWRRTRTKSRERRVWIPKEGWFSVLTRREIDFEPWGWRDAAPGPRA